TRLYLPAGATEPLPGVLLCHGVDNSKEQVEPLALAFAGRGFAALVFDFGGHGESDPPALRAPDKPSPRRRALAALAGRPEVDPRRLAVVGFSMGVPAAVQAAQENGGVRAVVALGRAGVPGTVPRNFLLGAGVYDEFQSPAAYLAALRAGT